VHAKRSFYAAVSGLFGKLLNLASKEVISELVRTKCTPILLYGLECFQLGKAELHSLDFIFNSPLFPSFPLPLKVGPLLQLAGLVVQRLSRKIFHFVEKL